jgi:hypothetical protein
MCARSVKILCVLFEKVQRHDKRNLLTRTCALVLSKQCRTPPTQPSDMAAVRRRKNLSSYCKQYVQYSCSCYLEQTAPSGDSWSGKGRATVTHADTQETIIVPCDSRRCVRENLICYTLFHTLFHFIVQYDSGSCARENHASRIGASFGVRVHVP